MLFTQKTLILQLEIWSDRGRNPRSSALEMINRKQLVWLTFSFSNTLTLAKPEVIFRWVNETDAVAGHQNIVLSFHKKRRYQHLIIYCARRVSGIALIRYAIIWLCYKSKQYQSWQPVIGQNSNKSLIIWQETLL